MEICPWCLQFCKITFLKTQQQNTSQEQCLIHPQIELEPLSNKKDSLNEHDKLHFIHLYGITFAEISEAVISKPQQIKQKTI